MATELGDGVWHFELRGVSAFLVFDDVPTLVDAGTPWDENALREHLAEIGLKADDIERILLTHYDLDHVGTLDALATDVDATVHTGPYDAEILTGQRSPPLSNHKGAFQRVTGLVTSLPSLEIEPIDDGDTIGSFTAYHTPGHTPGHVAYVSSDLDVGLLGDLVTESGGALSPSEWVMSYDTGTVSESIRQLADRAPPFEVACMGHGSPLVSGGSDALDALAERV
ncbi:MAG: MBL fold metallo-hydrolase [Halobellus sp.]|uniref:MBL fold metallo-hydrolase n=1 Tax=Halobellus sp. TaxID=1979212 RepID=UPI0035D50326